MANGVRYSTDHGMDRYPIQLSGFGRLSTIRPNPKLVFFLRIG